MYASVLQSCKMQNLAVVKMRLSMFKNMIGFIGEQRRIGERKKEKQAIYQAEASPQDVHQVEASPQDIHLAEAGPEAAPYLEVIDTGYDADTDDGDEGWTVPIKKSRKRQRNKPVWKRNQVRSLRVSGQSYTNCKKYIVPEKKPRLLEDVCHEKCRRKCSSRFIAEKRQQMFTTF